MAGWGKQGYQGYEMCVMEYKASRYNHHGNIESGILLYNLATSAVAVLNDDEYSQIATARFLDADLRQEAIANGFVVPSAENEVEKVLGLQRMNNFSTRFAGFQILPTTACNARCFYCYEQGFKPTSMDDKVADAIPGFIGGYLPMVDEIHVTWFGGEPLLGMRRICELSAKLMEMTEEQGVKYDADIITNATLATKENVALLAHDCHVTQAQITLDGLPEEHMRRKRYLSEDVTFDDIIGAMNAFVDAGIRLLIRLNVDKRNLGGCLSLIGQLGERYRGNDGVRLYAAPLYSVGDGGGFFGPEDIVSAYRRIFHALIDAGFIETINGLPLNFNNAICAAQMINNFVIAPSGDVFKCEHLLDYRGEKVGDVFDGIIFNDAMVRWCSPDVDDDCRKCSYLPSCQGGCYAAQAMGFGLKGKCPYVTLISEAIFDAARYLLGDAPSAIETDL